MQLYMHMFLYACMYVYMYACMHVYMYACMHVYMYKRYMLNIIDFFKLDIFPQMSNLHQNIAETYNKKINFQ
jgi:hypothetical protein